MTVGSVDVANHELFAALREDGCPMCRVLGHTDRQAVFSFLYEGHLDPAAQEAFVDAGGFCPAHSWALHRESERLGTGAVIARLYGRLAARDLEALDAGLAARPRRRRPRAAPRFPLAAGPCRMCRRLAASEARLTRFLLELLADAEAQEHYRRSDGLCRRHLLIAVATATESGDPADLATILARDWRDRLRRLATTLGEYDRNRDYRRAGARTPEEAASWTDIIRRYGGERSAGAGP